MEATVRDYYGTDEQHIVEFALRAWTPIFQAIGQILGPILFAQLRGDWRTSQAAAISEALATPAHRVWVAEQPDGVPVGFLVAQADPGSGVGEIVMVAVDPAWQRRGIATALTDVATSWLRQSGRQVAMIETGADPGHEPARHAYQKAGYTPLPAMRFFKSL